MTPGEARQRAFEASWGVFNHASRATVREDWKDAISAFERALWQPIETAPRDRSWIMTYQPGHGRVRAINIDYWAEEDGGWNGKPTHWRPLPAGPGDAP